MKKEREKTKRGGGEGSRTEGPPHRGLKAARSSSPTRRTDASGFRSSRRPASASAASRCRPAPRPASCSATSSLNGIGSLQYTGTSILLSEPETGGLVSEYSLVGGVNRTFGNLRPTGHEDDRQLHLALNSGLPLVDPQGGFFFVFQTGEPIFRKYDDAGRLVFERHIEGP